MGRRDVIKIASEDKVKADDQSREESFESHTSNPTPSELNPISEKNKKNEAYHLDCIGHKNL